jgi:3-hydroxyisobutyrate dehydrogenase
LGNEKNQIVMKAFLGMGLLGSNFVRAMLNKGEKVQVWNRTASKAKDLEQYGAKAFDNAKDAVKGAGIIHLTLKDDASVDQVLQAAEAGLTPGAIIIDHTTTSKNGAIIRTKQWKEKGFTYQHAPVFMGPSNALDGTGFMLVSGDEAVINQLEPELSKMTGKLLHFGTEPGKAAAMKLTGNAFLVCLTAGLKDTLSLAKALGISTEDVTTLFNSWNPGTGVAARIKRMTSPDHSNPSWELSMARKDTGLFLQAAQDNGISLTLLPAIAALMDQWIEKGYGNYDWTVIAG